VPFLQPILAKPESTERSWRSALSSQVGSPFGSSRVLHLEGERPERQELVSYQAKRSAPAAISVDSG
jgi:hypothetical protein